MAPDDSQHQTAARPPSEEREAWFDAELKQLFPLFLRDARKAVVAAREAMIQRPEIDWPKAAQSAHLLAGMGATFGHPEISALGHELEAAASERDEARARALAEALEKIAATLPLS